MKGIILSGGSGTRLYPCTITFSKQLLPIYDKPMIYYPLSVLMLAGIKNILIITTPKDLNLFVNLLGDGKNLGIKLQYKIQEKPRGLADAFLIAEEFISNEDVCLILGDNILYGDGISKILENSIIEVEKNKKAITFGYFVDKPSSFGVFEFDKKGKVINIEEKPKNPKSNYAVIGLYFYPNDVIKFAKDVVPSERGELEITSINKRFLDKNRLDAKILGRGYSWIDTGTHDNLVEASQLIKRIEKTTGFKIGCIEEIAFKKKFIKENELIKIISKIKGTPYSKYLVKILKNQNLL